MASVFGNILILILVVMCIKHVLLLVMMKLNQWRLSIQYGAKLPPGSLGWPYIGETLQLFSQNPNVFFSTRHKRYGDVFKTHILGCPCIMLASPEAAKFVLMTKSSLFKPTYPKSKERLIGLTAIFFQQGPYHNYIRKLVQSSLSLDTIKPFIPNIEAITISTLNSWAHGRVLNVFHELKKFTFDVAVLSIFGELDNHYNKVLKENYITLDKGYNSFPTKIPGTCFFKSLMARKKLGEIIKEIMEEKREKGIGRKNLLGYLLMSDKEGGKTTLTDDQIIDNVIGVLFAAQDTTASVLTWVLKYISDYPHLLQQIHGEQMAIYKTNGHGKQPLTWTQIKEMQITHRVILESFRMASIISFTYREAIQDVVYKGYVIPKGWKVLPLFRNIHHNPDFFENPQTFNPSRFQAATIKPNTFMPFGYGAHACPGNEVAKLLMLVFIHHLVTQFSLLVTMILSLVRCRARDDDPGSILITHPSYLPKWEVVGPQGGVQYDPFPVPEHGLPAKFRRAN